MTVKQSVQRLPEQELLPEENLQVKEERDGGVRDGGLDLTPGCVSCVHVESSLCIHTNKNITSVHRNEIISKSVKFCVHC